MKVSLHKLVHALKRLIWRHCLGTLRTVASLWEVCHRVRLPWCPAITYSDPFRTVNPNKPFLP